MPADPAHPQDLSVLTDQAVSLVGRLPGHVNRIRVASGSAEIEIEWAAPTVAAPPPQEDVTAPTLAIVPDAPRVPDAPVAPAGDLVTISSPVVGVFYDKPSPDEAPFVTVGDPVTVGQQVAIVEAMKLMNPIVSDVDGIVTAIRAAAGDSIEFGQPLIDVEPFQE